MSLGWRSFLEEMSWAVKNVHDCEIHGGGQLRET